MFVLLHALEGAFTINAYVNSLESALTWYSYTKSFRISTYVKNRGVGVITVNFFFGTSSKPLPLVAL
jgi:hypothetical protein